MDDFGDALKIHPMGLTIRFEVAPGTSELAVPFRFNSWRKSLEARLTEKATKGKANRQLIEEVAKILGVPENNVTILSGHKSARKILLVTGVDIDHATSCLMRSR
jgi:uncharacterized protein (TIGR00251 family)